MFEENKADTLTITDLAGNKIQKNIEITNIDKTAPNINVIFDNQPTNQSVTVTIKGNEEIKVSQGEEEEWTRGEDGKTLIKEYEENTTDIVKIRDLAGNEIQRTITIDNIDKTAPEVVVNYELKNIGNPIVIVTIKGNEEIKVSQGEEGWTRGKEGKTLIKEFDENTTKIVKIRDLAGNEINVEIDVNDLNKEGTEVEYSNKEPTNQDVIVTITSDVEVKKVDGWVLSDDKKILTKQYNKNGEETVKLIDNEGNERSEKVSVTNIDKTPPDIIEVKKTPENTTNQNVTVTIKGNEKIKLTKELDGWMIGEDEKTLTKEFKENKTDILTITDLAGNKISKTITVSNIDKTSPTISGTENGKICEDSVIVVAEDDHPRILTLKRNGKIVEGYTNGTEIIEEGEYKLTAEDNAGNKTEIGFTIKYKRGDLIDDDEIKMNDVLVILQHLAQEKNPKIAQKHREWKLDRKREIKADTNKNEKVEMNDVLKILQYLAAKKSEKIAQKHPNWLNIE